jgi:pyruvate dehydrogenase complex dehydrogenase (E1) component
MEDDSQLAWYILEDGEMDEEEREGELVEAAGVVLGVTLIVADQRRQRRAVRCQ